MQYSHIIAACLNALRLNYFNTWKAGKKTIIILIILETKSEKAIV